MKYDNQLRNAVQIINTFDGAMPLHNWLKDFFRQHKQMGSKDRKQAAELVYCFYRLGHASKKLPVAECILAGLFLCNVSSNEFLQYFKPTWNERINADYAEKIAMITDSLGSSALHFLESIFPWKNDLSASVDRQAYALSFLKQPDLFIRTRPGFENIVKEKLQEHGVFYSERSPSSLAVPNGTKLDKVLDLNKEAVIQDLNSQKIGSFLQIPGVDSIGTGKKCWDCCAASGGKSILLHDRYPAIELTVSDIRESILNNLKTRFHSAGINKYKSFVADLQSNDARMSLEKSSCDMIIADVPCTGSGTWSRNPDALYFFGVNEIERYQAKQKKILSNIVPYLKKGGVLVYITCSVFKKENEDVVDYLQENYSVEVETKELLKGYNQKADSMFVARLIV